MSLPAGPPDIRVKQEPITQAANFSAAAASSSSAAACRQSGKRGHGSAASARSIRVKREADDESEDAIEAVKSEPDEHAAGRQEEKHNQPDDALQMEVARERMRIVTQDGQRLEVNVVCSPHSACIACVSTVSSPECICM